MSSCLKDRIRRNSRWFCDSVATFELHGCVWGFVLVLSSLIL